MTKVAALDRVVKLVDSDYKPSYSKEKIVILDFKKGVLLKNKPLISFGRELRYYSISLERSVECEGLVCNVRDIETKQSINIKIDYDISCADGNQNQLVKAIYKRDNPKIAIEEYIEQWVKTFNKEKRKANINITNTFFEEKEALKAFIINKAMSVLGLEIHPFITLEGELELLNLVKQSSDNFPIRVTDYEHNIFIKYKIGLEVPNDSYKTNAILNYKKLPKLRILIKNEIEKFMIKEVKLHQLCFEFNSFIKPEIIQKLNLLLKSYGRQISFINFDLQIKDLLVPESPLITHVSKCKIKESPTLIHIENRVLLSLIDIGRFRRSNIENLKYWLEKKLDKISQEVFFERDRIDLIRNLDKDKLLIQEKLQQESQKIGYHVKHLASLPDLDELTLKLGFKLDNGSSSFRTSDSRVEIKLNVALNAKVSDFNGIESHLKDGVVKFKEKILQISNDIIEQEIREKHPSDIYKSAFEGENYIDNILKAKIKEALEDTFNLIDLRISILFLDTDLSDRMRELLAAFPSFAFSVVPNKTSVRLPYKISYKITGVDKDKYNTFQNNNFKADKVDSEIEEINEYLMEAVTKRIRDIPGGILLNSSLLDLQRLENEDIKPVMCQVAKEVFGLTVGAILISRLETELEKASVLKHGEFLELGTKTEIEIAATNKAMLMERLSLLDKQEKDLLSIGDKKGAKKIKKQIEELVNKIANYMDEYSEMNKTLGPANKNENSTISLGDYLLKNKLLGAHKGSNNQTKEGDIYEEE
ncbi:hypothetical protein [Psychroserpens sp.]